jgi:hypothetical protein
VKRLELHVVAAGTLLALGGACSRAGTTADAREPVVSPPNEQIVLPTQDELDSRANSDINGGNADAEFEKLRKEIEGDG